MLYGKRIYMREIIKEDIEILYELCANDEVLKYNGSDEGIASKRYMLDNFRYFKKPSKKDYVIVKKRGGILGLISYCEISYAKGVYSISIMIGKKYWGKGYGKEAIETVLEYLFNKKKAHKIELEVVEENKAAIRCYEKCNFQIEGKRRKKYFYKERYLDTILMSLLEDEYKAIRS